MYCTCILQASRIQPASAKARRTAPEPTAPLISRSLAGWLLQARNMRHSASMSMLQSATSCSRSDRSDSAEQPTTSGAASRPSGASTRHKLTIISNRLPVSATMSSSGKWELTVSAGGLVSALLGVNQVRFLVVLSLILVVWMTSWAIVDSDICKHGLVSASLLLLQEQKARAKVEYCKKLMAARRQSSAPSLSLMLVVWDRLYARADSAREYEGLLRQATLHQCWCARLAARDRNTLSLGMSLTCPSPACFCFWLPARRACTAPALPASVTLHTCVHSRPCS